MLEAIGRFCDKADHAAIIVADHFSHIHCLHSLKSVAVRVAPPFASRSAASILIEDGATRLYLIVFLTDFHRAWWVRAQKGRDQRPRTRTKAHRPRERAIPSQQGHGAQRRSLPSQIGRAHVCTPVTNAHTVCRLLLA